MLLVENYVNCQLLTRNLHDQQKLQTVGKQLGLRYRRQQLTEHIMPAENHSGITLPCSNWLLPNLQDKPCTLNGWMTGSQQK